MDRHSISPELIGGNKDLISEILLRLPAKSLIRLESVSKQWLALICDPQFSHRHTLRNPTTRVSGIFLRKSPAEHEFLSLDGGGSSFRPSFGSLDVIRDGSGIKILQSCNGLLLCSSLGISSKRNYYVFNPTSKRFVKLPPLVDDSLSSVVLGVCLAFDPSRSCNYKVVCVRGTSSSIYHYQIEIYSSEIGAWKLSGSPFVASFDMVFDNGVFWNGAVHWISPSGNALYFDVHKESISKMPKLPFSGGWRRRRLSYFGESCGHLHIIEVHDHPISQLKVFRMERDYSNWFVKYQVELDSVITAFPKIVRTCLHPSDSNYYAFVILCLIEEENGHEPLLLLHIPGKLIAYNFRDRNFREVCELASSQGGTGDSLQFGWLDAYPCTETLACV